jgi:hypothetical protein
VTWRIYKYYILAGGGFLFLFVIFFLTASQILQIYSSFWLTTWGKATIDARNKGTELTSSENIYYLNIFAVYSMCGVAGLTARAIVLAQHRMGTSCKDTIITMK